MDLATFLGVTDLLTAIGAGAALAVMTTRFAQHHTSVIEAMAQMAFLPEKRSRYIGLLSMEGSLFLLSAIVWGLGASGVVPLALVGPVLSLLILAGIVSVVGLSYLGLRPGRLTDQQRVAVQREAPLILQSLAFAPIQRIPGGDLAGNP